MSRHPHFPLLTIHVSMHFYPQPQTPGTESSTPAHFLYSHQGRTPPGGLCRTSIERPAPQGMRVEIQSPCGSPLLLSWSWCAHPGHAAPAGACSLVQESLRSLLLYYLPWSPRLPAAGLMASSAHFLQVCLMVPTQAGLRSPECTQVSVGESGWHLCQGPT